MSNHTQLKQQYLNVIIKLHHDIHIKSLTDDKSFVEDFGFDSLDFVELIMELEKEFNINIPDDKAEKFDTIGKGFQLLLETKLAL